MRKLILTAAILGLMSQAWADIVPGKTYRIVNVADDTKSVFVANSSLDASAQVVLWTDTKVSAQEWTAEEGEDGTYTFRNVYTGMYMARNSERATNSSRMQQIADASDVKAQWTLQPVDASDNTYMLMQQSTTYDFYLYTSAIKDGQRLSLITKRSDDKLAQQQWKFIEVEPQTAFSEAIRTRVMDGWTTQFLQTVSGGKTFTKGGWGEAEILETLLDAYEVSGNKEYLTTFSSVFNYFKSKVGENWLHLVYEDAYKWYGHDFNDDVMWMIIASVRAYHLTGTKSYLTLAKQNFDAIYERALNKWGMLRWAEQSGGVNGTNSCINGPAEVAACYLADALSDESYYEKARSLYDNQRKYLYNASTGEVWDSFTWDADKNEPSGYNKWVSTYNQGTMLGAALLLYRHYGDSFYKEDAENIVACTKRQLCDSHGIIKVCQTVDGDLCGFKGIIMRYLRRYVTDLGKPEDVAWLQANAMHAYNNMNSHDVICSAWLTKSAEDWKYGDTDYSGQAFGCSTAVSAVFNAPLDSNLIVKDAYNDIRATDFDYMRGIYVTESDGNKVVDNIKKGFYTCYKNVEFGDVSASGIELKASAARKSSQIEVRLDSLTADPIAVVSMPTDGDLNTVTAEISGITGRHDVYLSYVATSSRYSAFTLTSFKFTATGSGISAVVDGDAKKKGTLKVYPNPVVDTLTVVALSDSTINVYTSDGQLSRSQPASEGENSVDFSSLSDGLYLVQVVSADGVQVAKVVK